MLCLARSLLPLLLLLLSPLAGGAATNTSRSIVTPGNSHSLADSYQFDPRDGWEPVLATNLRYKYRRSPARFSGTASSDISNVHSRSALKRPPSPDTRDSVKDVLTSAVNALAKFTKGLFGIGEPEPVIVTWYTGHDLLNPSCWDTPKWAPTDRSFVAALTLEGWLEKPKCFTFLELCRNASRCTFVRVVDTCAGCAEGSKHVDLTRAAFAELASLEQGVMTVQMRRANEPEDWSEELWGPRKHD